MTPEELEAWAIATEEREWDTALDIFEAAHQPDERRVAILIGLKSADVLPEPPTMQVCFVDDHFETVARVWDRRDEQANGYVHPDRVIQRGFHTRADACDWIDSRRSRAELDAARSRAAAKARQAARARAAQ